jgi:hypothetical protein
LKSKSGRFDLPSRPTAARLQKKTTMTESNLTLCQRLDRFREFVRAIADENQR